MKIRMADRRIKLPFSWCFKAYLRVTGETITHSYTKSIGVLILSLGDIIRLGMQQK